MLVETETVLVHLCASLVRMMEVGWVHLCASGVFGEGVARRKTGWRGSALIRETKTADSPTQVPRAHLERILGTSWAKNNGQSHAVKLPIRRDSHHVTCPHRLAGCAAKVPVSYDSLNMIDALLMTNLAKPLSLDCSIRIPDMNPPQTIHYCAHEERQCGRHEAAISYPAPALLPSRYGPHCETRLRLDQ